MDGGGGEEEENDAVFVWTGRHTAVARTAVAPQREAAALLNMAVLDNILDIFQWIWKGRGLCIGECWTKQE